MRYSYELYDVQLFAETEVFRPTRAIEREIDAEIADYLLNEFAPGEYRDASQINSALQHLFRFYEERLEQLLPAIAGRNAMEFVLHQYDLATQIKSHWDNERLSPFEREEWRTLGRTFRRAAKYFAERLCAVSTEQRSQLSEAEWWSVMGQVWICCEELIALSNSSTQTFALFPEDTILTISPAGSSQFVTLRLTDDVVARLETFQHRQEREVRLRNKYIDQNHLIFNEARVAEYFDGPFLEVHGFTIAQAWSLLSEIIESVIVDESSLPIPFVDLKSILIELQRLLGDNELGARVVVSATTVGKDSMISEGRVIWKPKQHYRASARPFFKFPHEAGLHLTWSKGMARECLLMLWIDLAFRRLPPEWCVSKGISSAAEAYAASINREFEEIVITRLRQLGIVVERFNRTIGVGVNAINIPAEVGDIDILGYDPKSRVLIVGDSKMVKWSVEPATFRDDLDKFIGNGRNYIQQIATKYDWVRENAPAVVRALESDSRFPNTISISSTSKVIVTYFPTIASCYVSHMPCVSLTEVMEDYQEYARWPYLSEPISIT